MVIHVGFSPSISSICVYVIYGEFVSFRSGMHGSRFLRLFAVPLHVSCVLFFFLSVSSSLSLSPSLPPALFPFLPLFLSLLFPSPSSPSLRPDACNCVMRKPINYTWLQVSRVINYKPRVPGLNLLKLTTTKPPSLSDLNTNVAARQAPRGIRGRADMRRLPLAAKERTLRKPSLKHQSIL